MQRPRERAGAAGRLIAAAPGLAKTNLPARAQGPGTILVKGWA
jgi:hypothetical protein